LLAKLEIINISLGFVADFWKNLRTKMFRKERYGNAVEIFNESAYFVFNIR